MRQLLRILAIPILALPVALALGACDGSSGTTGPPPTGTATLTVEITGVRTLSRDTVYTVVGFVVIQPGARLVIPSGTILESDDPSRGSLVTARCTATQPSGQLIVQGTSGNPVIFRPATTGSRQRGMAGGVVLHGCAPVNQPGTPISEGIGQAFGGNNPTDSSGDIRFLRIEFGGKQVAPDNEINGLTMAGVGSATVIENVQAHFIADDGFEWFGGTVNAKFLVSSGNDDDNLDCDWGWTGTVQFFVVVQDRNLANRGVECDNDANGSGNTPITSPNVWNVTLIGAGLERANSEVNDAVYVRRNAAGTWRNILVANYGNAGLVIDGTASQANLTAGTLNIDNVLFFRVQCIQVASCSGAADAILGNVAFRGGSPSAYHQTGVAAAFASKTIIEGDPLLTSVNYDNPINGSPPDLRPAAGSPALVAANAGVPVGPGVDATARFIGAFNASNNWMAGWTTWAVN
jgi:hypothetical protein